MAKSKKVIGAQLEFVDIAGLVRGASEGAGLGNEFLSNIRQVFFHKNPCALSVHSVLVLVARNVSG